MTKENEKDARAPDVENTNDEARQGKVRRDKPYADFFELEFLDEDKILQEKLFSRKLVEKGIVLPYADDSTVLLNYDARRFEDWNSTTIARNIIELREIDDVIMHYWKYAGRSYFRLRNIQTKHIRNYTESPVDDSHFKEKFRRVSERVDDYAKLDKLLMFLSDLVQETIKGNEVEFDKRYRREVGERIRSARQKKKITQSDVAQRLGISRNSYLKYEKGEHDVSIPNLIRLTNFLDVTPNYLFGVE